MKEGQERTCEMGHRFRKTSDCPTCPQCEAAKKPSDDFLSQLAAPARRALEREGIISPTQLALWTEKEILSLHGMGPGSIPKLLSAMKKYGVNFRVG